MYTYHICNASTHFNAFRLYKRFRLVKGSAWILLCIISAVTTYSESGECLEMRNLFFAFCKRFHSENSVWVDITCSFLFFSSCGGQTWCRRRQDLSLLITCGFIGLENWKKKRKFFVDQCDYNCCLLCDGSDRRLCSNEWLWSEQNEYEKKNGIVRDRGV